MQLFPIVTEFYYCPMDIKLLYLFYGVLIFRSLAAKPISVAYIETLLAASESVLGDSQSNKQMRRDKESYLENNHQVRLVENWYKLNSTEFALAVQFIVLRGRSVLMW